MKVYAYALPDRIVKISMPGILFYFFCKYAKLASEPYPEELQGAISDLLAYDEYIEEGR